MNLKNVIHLSGILLLMTVSLAGAVVPPCLVPLNPNNPYHGPMDPGYEMAVLYPAGTYDLWYAELPMTFSTSEAADYQNWNWQKIPDVEIRENKEVVAYLGLTGDITGPEDWIYGYDDISVGSQVGSIRFHAGSQTGSTRWAAVLCSTGGGPGGCLILGTKTYHTDDTIEVFYKGSSSYEDDAWVGIIPSYVPHGNEQENDDNDVDYEYIGKSSSGKLVFEAPSPGEWDFRMFNSDSASIGKEICSVSFTVIS